MLESAGKPEFRPFDPSGEVRIYMRNLPHWRQSGCTYFVTLRLGDSIPAKVLAQWKDMRSRWYDAHRIDLSLKESSPKQFAAQYSRIPEGVRRAFEREQARMLHEELDRCHGSCTLKHAHPRSEVVNSLQVFHGERHWLGDFVVMPNHVHAIVTPFDHLELEDLLGSIKKWTSRVIGIWLKSQPKEILSTQPTRNKARFWQYESYDRIIRDAEELFNFRTYIADNPKKARLAPGHFEYHAAKWLDEFAPRPS